MGDLIQKAASIDEIVKDHINGLSGYQIAEKYGLDTEVVKDVIRDADARGAFVPEGVVTDGIPVDNPEPLVEGENPEPAVMSTSTDK